MTSIDKRQHDGLVDAQQDFRQGHRQTNMAQQLRAGAARDQTGLNQFFADRAHAMGCIAHRRSQGIEDDGDQGSEIANPEQHDNRDQVDKAGQRFAACRLAGMNHRSCPAYSARPAHPRGTPISVARITDAPHR